MLNIIVLFKETSFPIVLNWLCLEFSYLAISAVMDIMFFLHIFKLKKENSKLFLYIITLVASRLAIYLIIPQPYYKIIDLLIIFAVFRFEINQTTEKSIIGTLFNSVPVITLEMIFSRILIEVFSNINSYQEGICNFEYSLSLKFLILLSRFLIFIVAYKTNFHISFNDHLQSKNKKSIIIDSLFGIALIIVTEIELFNSIKNFSCLRFCLLTILYLYISFRNMLSVNLIELQSIKIHTLETYNRTLSIMYDSVRGFKHDFSNFVVALDGYVETENLKGIKQMSKSILKECVCTNKMEVLDPKVIDNPAIYSIVTNKYYLAKEQHLNMNIEIMSKIDNNENIYEICRILGILLDNAIEAAKDSKDKILNIKFISDAKVNRKLIIVENSYENKNINLNQIFEKGFTSKEIDSKKHGLGLWNIRKILMNNEKLNLYTTADDLFRQQLEIY